MNLLSIRAYVYNKKELYGSIVLFIDISTTIFVGVYKKDKKDPKLAFTTLALE